MRKMKETKLIGFGEYSDTSHGFVLDSAITIDKNHQYAIELYSEDNSFTTRVVFAGREAVAAVELVDITLGTLYIELTSGDVVNCDIVEAGDETVSIIYIYDLEA